MSSFGDWRPTRRIAKPAEFHPNQTFTTDLYTYALDHKARVGRRTALASSANPPVYFEISPTLRPAPEPVKATRGRRRLWPQVLFAGVVIVAMAVLVYPFIPAVQYQVAKSSGELSRTKQKLETVPLTTDNQLIIPAIGVNTPILESSSINVLLTHEGVWHQTGALPTGSLVLAGHRWRYLPPNTSTLYNLGELSTGDQIIVDWYSKRYIYSVQSVQTIPATNTSILTEQDPGHIYVYTCQDWLMTKRILVTGVLVPQA